MKPINVVLSICVWLLAIAAGATIWSYASHSMTASRVQPHAVEAAGRWLIEVAIARA